MSERTGVVDTLPRLPSIPPGDFLGRTREAVARSGRKVVVVDDDPTGTQTVHGTTALLRWDHGDLVDQFRSPRALFFVLTNSRSLTEPEAVRVSQDLSAALGRASDETGVGFSLVSRSDSTLRGHFPAEVDALCGGCGKGLPVVLIPAFMQGGRYTFGNVHYVKEGSRFVPAAQTEFAADATFGYRHSDLREWVAEKTGGRTRSGDVAVISIDDIRTGGVERVVSLLSGLRSGSVCVVNAVDLRDLEVVACGLAEAEARGVEVVLRSAASIVPLRVGQEPRPLLTASDLAPPRGGTGGLVVVGSYVSRSTSQVARLIERMRPQTHELKVEALIGTGSRDGAIDAARRAVNAGLASGALVVLYTERRLVVSEDRGLSRAIGQLVASGLNSVVSGLTVAPRFVIAKGGITSHEVAAVCCRARTVEVLGQVSPGVPLWRLGPESAFPGMPYVVFPGNVGGEGTLAEVCEMFL
jgi:uncharacterized protein YgbK (DUF1537 family)